MSHDWFADEIAIDFPSVGPAVERMRDAFLGVRVDDVVRADLSVTRREANGGRTIPIELPMRRTCEGCGGRGETWTARCAECHGTGTSLFQHTFRLALPAGVADGARLRFRVSVPGAASVRVEVRVAVQSANRGIG
jgi:hypothetical protein